MAIATHLIKVSGAFDPEIWNASSIKEYVTNKITEIEKVLHPDLELFSIHDVHQIDVWLYLMALPSEVTQEIVDKWIKDHIIDEGLIVKKAEIEVVNDILNPRGLFVLIE